MRVLNIVFNDNARPLRNNTFIDVAHVGHRGVEMELLDGGIVSVVFPKPNFGSYGVPVSSLSHVRFESMPEEHQKAVLEVDLAPKPKPKPKPKKKPKLYPRVSA